MSLGWRGQSQAAHRRLDPRYQRILMGARPARARARRLALGRIAYSYISVLEPHRSGDHLLSKTNYIQRLHWHKNDLLLEVLLRGK